MALPTFRYMIGKAFAVIFWVPSKDPAYIANTTNFNQRNPELIERIRQEDLARGCPAPLKPFVELIAHA